MLILAGVSLNAIIGDNGIITNAQEASIKTEIAVLEEYLQQKYVEVASDYDGFANGENELEILRSNFPDLIYNPSEITGLQYILNNGNIYYLIDKNSLPNDLKNNLKLGDCGRNLTGIEKYNDFSNFKDVYGLTSNLKVYYCSDGLNSLIGTSEEIKDSPTRIAIKNSNSSNLVDALVSTYDWIKTDDDGNILAEKLDSIQVLNLENATLSNLKGLYNFSSMTTLNIRNSTITNLSGIESATLLTKLYMYNSSVNDYSGLCNAINLNSFLIDNAADSDVAAKVGNGLSNSKLSNLEYFGIYSSPLVTNIDGINLISSTTKDSIKYLYLTDNTLTDTATIDNGFNHLYSIDISHKSANRVNDTLTRLALSSFPELQEFSGYYLTRLTTITGISAPKLYLWDTNYNPYLEKPEGLSNQSNLNTLRCESNQFSDLDFLSTNTSNLQSLTFRSNMAITSLDGLKNNTSLTYLYLDNCTNLGKNLDISDGETSGTYVTLQKSNTNLFAALSNKTALYYLKLTNSPYLGYLSHLDNCPLTNLHVSGCNNIVVSDVSADNTLKTRVNNMGASAKSYPSYLSTAFLTSTSNYYAVSQNKMNVSEFEALGNVTGLVTLLLDIDYLTDTDGNNLDETNTNLTVNTTLSSLTSLKFVRLKFRNLSQITFVTNCSLCSIDVRYTKIGTHTTKNEDGTFSNEYTNGLEMLNGNVSDNFYYLGIGSTNYVDLSKIQPALNKMNTSRGSTGGYISTAGINGANQDVLNTLKSCTNLTRFVSCNVNDVTYDLSNCTKLESVYWRDSYTGGFMILPDTSTNFDENNNPIGFTLQASTTSAGRFSGGKACRKVTIERVIRCDGNEWWSNFNGFKNSTILKEISITTYATGEDTAVAKTLGSDKFNEIFGTCTNLETIYVNCGIRDGSTFTSISGLSNLTKLSSISFHNTAISTIPDLSKSAATLRTINITNSCLADISGVDSTNGALVNLTTLNLSNNSIGDLSPTKNLTALINLNLNTNSIKATTTSARYGDVNNIQILNYLYSEKTPKCTNINVAGNQLKDTEKASLADGIVK